MKVEIKTEIASVILDMEAEKVYEMIGHAVKMAGAPVREVQEYLNANPINPCQDNTAPTLGDTCRIGPGHQAETKPARPKRRVETLFGDKSQWGGRKDEKQLKPMMFRGFLCVRCESCGRERSFCTKEPLSFHRCACGSLTPLRDMKKAQVSCSCGGEFNYQTNIKANGFTMKCLQCGAMKELVTDRKGGFVTAGKEARHADWK